MPHKLLLTLRACFVIMIMGLSLCVVSAQSFYQIYGPQLIQDLCGWHEYGLETDAQITETEWFLSPSDGQILSGTLYNVNIQFPAPGTYTLFASSVSVNGEVLRDTMLIQVYGQSVKPEVVGCYELNLVSDCYKVCAGSKSIIEVNTNANFEVYGAESYQYISEGLEITWGNGGDADVVVVYPGQCDVRLCFEILPKPFADFSSFPASVNDTVIVCQNQEIIFENESFNALSYSWDFGDGNESESFNATHAYKDPGLYTAILHAESICECNDSKQIIVRVLAAPAPTLDCVNSVCPGSRQRYTASSDECNVFYWTVSGNGTIVNGGGVSDDFIEIIWHNGPEGVIELSVDNCNSASCPVATIFRIPVISPDGPITGKEMVCSGNAEVYTVPYFPGTHYTWDLGSHGTILSGQNSNSIVVQWYVENINSQKFTSVTVEYNNCFLECGGKDTLAVSISPDFELTGDSEVCENGEATIAALHLNIVNVPVQWHIENEQGQIVFTQPGLSNTITHTFSYPPGDYEWVATNLSPMYCISELRHKIRVIALPTPPDGILGDTLICAGQTYGFTVDESGPYNTFWGITDGTATYFYEGNTCNYTFGSLPPYIVSAYHVDIQYAACVSDPLTITLHTAASHTIQGASEACVNDVDLFSFALINGADYKWEVLPTDHAEIRKSDQNNVEVYWTQSGPATLRLQLCGFVFDQIVDVHSLPAVNVVGPSSVCGNESALITTGNPSLPHTWLDENNNIIGTSGDISLSPGHYAVSLVDTKGCSDKSLFEILSLPVPSINISTAYPTVYCGSIPAGVKIVVNTDGTDYVFNWFKDNVAIGGGSATWHVTDFGTYHAEVTNQYGCKSISDQITFLDCCIPADCILPPGCFLPGCAYIPQDFDIVTSGTDCRSRTYTPMWPDIIPDQSRWSIESVSLGGIAIVEADILQYNYTYPGYYLITMTGLIDGHTYLPGICGHFQELMDTIRAIPDFGFQGQCAGAMITFEDLTTFLPDESIVSWSWNFDDPASGVDNSSSVQDPTHIFSLAGDYDVQFRATLASGCSVTMVKSVNISSGPPLSPTFDAVFCEKEALRFDLPGELFEINWAFGDPSSGIENGSTDASPYHTFNLPGIYSTSVSAMDVFGCSSQKIFPIDVRANTLSGTVTVDPTTPICFGDTATLTSPSGGLSWLWNTSETTEMISTSESNQYNVFIQDQYHCTYAPPPVFVSVSPQPEMIIKGREIFGPGEYGTWETSLQMCYGTSFELQVFAAGNIIFYWQNLIGDPSLVFTPEGANLPLPGDHQFWALGFYNNTGCISDTVFFDVEIFSLPAVPLISLVSGPGCSANDNELQVTNPESGIQYHWSDGQTGESIITKSAGDYTVKAVSINGCSSTSTAIRIKPAAPVDQIPGGCHLKCDPLTVCLPPINNVTSWSIFQNGNPFQSGTAWPDDFILTDDGSYTIEVTTANGCVATSDPLDIALYTGVGSVTVVTYLDVDHDGIITAADVILPGMPVVIISDDGLHEGSSTTLSGGEFVFKDYPSATYTAHFDPDLLSSEWKIIIDSMQAQILTCDDSVVVSLLLDMNCFVTGPDLYFENCPGAEFILGDSIWTDTGAYVMHVASTTGCDSVFNVHITWPDSLEVGTTVWVDVDQNGIVSPADTVISGITIVVDAGISQSPFIGITDANGYVNGNYPSRFYFISIDSTLLPPGYSIVYGTDIIPDSVCGMAVYDFLIVTSCSDVFIIQQEEMCEGDSLFIEGQWISNAGVYSYQLTDGSTGCDSTLDVYVSTTLNPLIQSVVDWNCIDLGSIVLTIEGIGPYQYDWSTSILTDSLATSLDDGIYIVSVSDINGCFATDTILVAGSVPLHFDVPGLYEINTGDSVEIIVSGDIGVSGLNFDWSTIDILSCATCPTSLAYPLSDTTITIQITDADSCVYMLETKIIIKVREDSTIFDQIYAPNVFSPNGDNINDRFTFFSRLPDVYVYELTIMDRWGEMVFHIDDIDLDAFEGWDGTFRDKTMNPGVFVYFARVKLSDDQDVRLVGDVTLLR